MTSKSKTVKGGDTVLSCKKGGDSFAVTADSFSAVDFKGVVVSGEAYYVDKAVKLGATTDKPSKKKKAEK